MGVVCGAACMYVLYVVNVCSNIYTNTNSLKSTDELTLSLGRSSVGVCGT